METDIIWGLILLLDEEGFKPIEVEYRGVKTGDILWVNDQIEDASFLVKDGEFVNPSYLERVAVVTGHSNFYIEALCNVTSSVWLAKEAYDLHLEEHQVSDKESLAYDLIEYTLDKDNLLKNVTLYSNEPINVIQEYVEYIINGDSKNVTIDKNIGERHLKYLLNLQASVTAIDINEDPNISFDELTSYECLTKIISEVDLIMTNMILQKLNKGKQSFFKMVFDKYLEHYF